MEIDKLPGRVQEYIKLSEDFNNARSLDERIDIVIERHKVWEKFTSVEKDVLEIYLREKMNIGVNKNED